MNGSLHLSGWGYTSSAGRVDDLVETDKLRHTTLDVMSLKECRYRWQGGSDAASSDSSGATEIIPSMLCAIRANTTSCYGDSGGEY